MPSRLESVLVEELMTRTQVSVEATQTLHLADALMSARGLQHLPVVDEDNNLLGLVSHRDIVAAELGTARHEARLGDLDPEEDEHYRQQHLLRPVASIMTTEVVTLTTDMTMRVAANHLLRSRHGFAPVLLNMGLVGILSEDDMLGLCMRYFRNSPMQVADIMTRELVTAPKDMSLIEAVALMEKEDIHHLLVADSGGHLTGLVSHRDILMLQRSLTGSDDSQVWTLRDIASKDAWTTTTTTSVLEAAQTLRDNHFGCLPVVEKKHLLGIITLSDFLRALLRDDTSKTPQVRTIEPCGAYVSKNVCRVAPEQSIARAFQCFAQYATSSLLVVESDTAVGILSHTDVLRAMHESPDVEALLESPLSTLMSRHLVTIAADQGVDKAAALMTRMRLHQVVVEHEDRPPGLLGTREILQAVHDQRVGAPLRDIMTSVIFSIDAQESVKSAQRYLRQAELSGLIVHDGQWPVGIFGQPEALASLDMAPEAPVESVMCSKIICLQHNMPASLAAQQAEALGARHIIVLDGGDTVGLATATDFAGLLASRAPSPSQP